MSLVRQQTSNFVTVTAAYSDREVTHVDREDVVSIMLFEAHTSKTLPPKHRKKILSAYRTPI